MHGTGQETIFTFRDALHQDPHSASARAGLAAALSDRNPIYRGLIRAEFWASARPNWQLMAIRILPFILGPIAIAMRTGPAAVTLYVVTGVVILVGFEIEPITGLTVLSSATDRGQLRRSERLAAISFAAFVVASVVCLIGAARDGWPVGAAAGCVAWALIGGLVQLDGDAAPVQVLRYSPVVAALLGAVTLVLGGSGADGAAFAVGLVFAISVVPAVCIAMPVQSRARVRAKA